MSGRHSFDRLRTGLSAKDRAEAAALADRMERDLSLAELRRARAMTQEQLTADLHVGQTSTAKLERRMDMYLSTLRRFVEAIGANWKSSPALPTSLTPGCAVSASWMKTTAPRKHPERPAAPAH